MTVLAPAMLFLGLAVAVPLLLHLLQRHQGPRMVFPALRYLRRAEREHASRIRLRQILLLALRVLAILLLAAAAARPFLQGGGSGHEPTSVVLVLDNSLSSGAVVGDQRILDGLKAAALQTLESAGPDDRFWLIQAGAPWEPAITGTAETVAAAVRGTEPTGGAADLAGEVERATSILAGEPDGRAREVQLLSDLQSSSFRRIDAGGDAVPVVTLLPDGPPPANRGVGSVEVGGGLPPRAGERSMVVAEVSGAAGTRAGPADPDTASSTDAAGGVGEGSGAAGAAAPDSVQLRLVLDGSVRAAAAVRAGDAAVLPFPAREAGLVVGRVEIDADALAGDDRRHFVTRVTAPAAVGITESLPFLEEALDVLEEAGRIRRVPPGSADVLLAPGAMGAEAVRSGGAVVILPPASSLELAAANQRLSAAGIPWRFGPPQGGEARLLAGEGELDQVLADARLREVYALEPQGSPSDSTLLRLRSGEAWAVAGAARPAGRYIVLGTPLTADGSSIPTSEAMLPLLDRIVSAWVADVSERTDYRPGDVVTLPAGDSLAGPDGTIGPVQGIHRLSTAGTYRVFADGDVVAAYAVNPPSAESDLSRMEESALADVLAGKDVRTASAGDWGDTIFTDRLGLEISWPLLLTALLLLLVESGLAAAGRGEVRPRTDRGAAGGRAPVPGEAA